MIFSENLLLCIAVPLAIAIPFLRGNTRRFPVCFLLGLGVCLLSAYISGFSTWLLLWTAEIRPSISPR